MGYTATDLTAYQIDNEAADKPCLLTTNEGYNYRNVGAATTGWSTDGDIGSGIDPGADGFPKERAFDLYYHIKTKPEGSASTTWWFVFDAGSEVMNIDSVVIANHNLFSAGGDTEVQVFMSDVEDIASGGTLVHTTATLTSDHRIVILDMTTTSDAQLFTNVRYVGIKFDLENSIKPEVGEITLSSRRQLAGKSLIPYDDKKTQSSFSSFTSDGGVTTNYVRYTGKAERNLRRLTRNATEIAAIEGFWADIEYGTQPFYYVENPNSAPSEAFCMYLDPAVFDFPDSGGGVRDFKAMMVEQAPFLSKE